MTTFYEMRMLRLEATPATGPISVSPHSEDMLFSPVTLGTLPLTVARTLSAGGGFVNVDTVTSTQGKETRF
jgi:hypothetical protein